MKARVKATNQIVEVEEYSKYLESGWKYRDINTGTLYKAASLDFSTEAVVDYWTRLEHQYAGMAMQGMLNNSLLITGLLKVNKSHEDIVAEVTGTAIRYAHVLVEKMKEANR